MNKVLGLLSYGSDIFIFKNGKDPTGHAKILIPYRNKRHINVIVYLVKAVSHEVNYIILHF